MARMTSHLEKRGSTYYARIDTPTDLVAHYGTTTRKVSLRTKNEREARDRLSVKIAEWRLEFADVRSRREITTDDQAEAVWRHYEATLRDDEERRRSFPTPAELEADQEQILKRIDRGELPASDMIGTINAYTDYELKLRARTDDARHRARRLTALKAALTSGDVELIEPSVRKFVSDNRLLVEPGTDQDRELSVLMIRAEIEGLERTLERDRGDYSGTPRDPIVKPTIGTAREAAKSGETILELFEKYARQNTKGIKADTINQARRDIRTFLDLHGSTLPAHRIDKKSVAAWIDLLMLYPVKATETKAFKGMHFSQVIRENEKIGKPAITPRTVNRYLAGLGAFCDWLVRRGILPANPTEGLSLGKQKRNGNPTFTTEQMATLFQSPLFVGCESDQQPRFYSKRGSTLIRDYRYWVPLVMLYSGARPGEIAQLLVSDVRTQDGVWFMHITTLGDDDKSVKTGGSMRVVPIHSELIRLGFLAYRDKMEKTGQRKLFPTAERNSRGQMIADFSRDFGRYLERIGVKEGRGLSLYSFRHGATDALRRAGYLDADFGFILGHAKGGTTGLYGIVPQGMLRQRTELIEAISYPHLDLTHLYSITENDLR